MRKCGGGRVCEAGVVRFGLSIGEISREDRSHGSMFQDCVCYRDYRVCLVRMPI